MRGWSSKGFDAHLPRVIDLVEVIRFDLIGFIFNSIVGLVYSAYLLVCWIVVVFYLQFGLTEWSVLGFVGFPREFCFPSAEIVFFVAEITHFFVEIILCR